MNRSPDPTEWNPEDGPPPTPEELAEAAALAEALDAKVPSAQKPSLLADALAVRATEHKPEAPSVDAAVRRAVDAAVAATQSRRRTRSLRLVAAAAAVALGLSALPASRLLRGEQPAAPAPPAPVSFTEALGEHPGSAPSARIASLRTRALRDQLLGAAGGAP